MGGGYGREKFQLMKIELKFIGNHFLPVGNLQVWGFCKCFRSKISRSTKLPCSMNSKAKAEDKLVRV